MGRLRGTRVIYAMAFSSNGQRILAYLKGNIKTWVVATGSCLQLTEDREHFSILLTVSRDDLTLASLDLDGTIEVLNAETDACIETFAGRDSLHSACSPPGML